MENKTDTNTTFEYLKIFSKTMEGQNNTKFNVYYGYMGTYNKDTKEFTDKISKDGKAHSVKVHLNDEIEKLLLKEDNFPYIITLKFDPNAEDEPYFATIDKDKDGKPRLDKEGKRHYIIFVNSMEAHEHARNKPRKLSDIDFDEI